MNPNEIEDQILCGQCKAPVQIESYPGPETMVRCPICGVSETLEEARREASKHIAHSLLRAALWPMKAGEPEVSYRFHATRIPRAAHEPGRPPSSSQRASKQSSTSNDPGRSEAQTETRSGRRR
jgi:hypothetical protein